MKMIKMLGGASDEKEGMSAKGENFNWLFVFGGQQQKNSFLYFCMVPLR